MSQPSPSISPVEKFLGKPAARGGPFALLALTPEDCSPELIVLQLQRQLERVAAHPEAGGYDADEVRLVLHAAAAQLLERGPIGEIRPGESGGAAPGAPSPATLAMEQAVVATMAEYGGWNRDSLHRLMLVAQSRGVPPQAMVGAINAVSTPRGPSVGEAQPVEPHGAKGAGNEAHASFEAPASRRGEDSGQRAVRLIVGVMVVAVVGLVLVAGSLLLLPKKQPPTAGGPASAGSQPGADKQGAKVTELFPAGPASPTDGVRQGEKSGDSAGFRELRAELEAIARLTPAEGGPRFAKVWGMLSTSWVRSSPDQAVALLDGVVEAVYRMSEDEQVLAGAMDAIVLPVSSLEGGAGPPKGDAVVRHAWSAGVLARLSRERDLPAIARRVVREAQRGETLRGLSGGEASFQAGAASALQLSARRLVPRDAANPPTLEAWRAWLGATRAAVPQARQRDRLVLLAIDSMLRDSPSGGSDRASFEILPELVRGVTWKPGDESRGWLLRWLGSPVVSSQALYAITSTLANGSLAPGVDISLVVPTGAGDQTRSDIRERLREVWSQADVATRAQRFADWVKAARERADEAPAERSNPQRLARALAFSRLSESAAWLWAGRVGPDQTPLNAEVATIEAEMAGPASSGGVLGFGSGGLSGSGGASSAFDPDAGVPGEGSWAARYAGFQNNLAQKRVMLGEYSPSAMISIEAGLITLDAIRGGNAELRRAAQGVLRRNANEPAFVLALLDLAPVLPATMDNADLVRDLGGGAYLPVLRDPTWRPMVRRALVERVLELTSARGHLAGVDAVAALFAESYDSRASAATAGGESSEDDPTKATPPDAKRRVPPVEDSAQLLRSRLLVHANTHPTTGREPARLEDLAVAHAARLRLASGRVQRFAAEQMAATELLAYLVANENPSKGERVREVLSALAERRRHAKHVAEQIEATEEACVRLWILRVEEETP